jgi:hypothetical protein
MYQEVCKKNYLGLGFLYFILLINCQTIPDANEVIITSELTVSNSLVASLANYRICFSIKKILLDTLLDVYIIDADTNKTLTKHSRFEIKLTFPDAFKSSTNKNQMVEFFANWGVSSSKEIFLSRERFLMKNRQLDINLIIILNKLKESYLQAKK